MSALQPLLISLGILLYLKEVFTKPESPQVWLPLSATISPLKPQSSTEQMARHPQRYHLLLYPPATGCHSEQGPLQ